MSGAGGFRGSATCEQRPWLKLGGPCSLTESAGTYIVTQYSRLSQEAEQELCLAPYPGVTCRGVPSGWHAGEGAPGAEVHPILIALTNRVRGKGSPQSEHIAEQGALNVWCQLQAQGAQVLWMEPELSGQERLCTSATGGRAMPLTHIWSCAAAAGQAAEGFCGTKQWVAQCNSWGPGQAVHEAQGCRHIT